MPDIPVEPAGGGRYPPDMESRIAVLEQIARTTVASLERIERRLETGFAQADLRMDRIDGRMDRMDGRMDRIDRRLDMFAAEHRSDFRWLLGMMLGTTGTILAALAGMLGAMAHGFHWL